MGAGNDEVAAGNGNDVDRRRAGQRPPVGPGRQRHGHRRRGQRQGARRVGQRHARRRRRQRSSDRRRGQRRAHIAGPATTTLSGQGGNDAIDRRPGNDRLAGGSGERRDRRRRRQRHASPAAPATTRSAATPATTCSMAAPATTPSRAAPATTSSTAGAGADRLTGGPGNDNINSARDGSIDHVACGTGADKVFVDANDVVSSDCERVHRVRKHRAAVAR